jgi:hypothetical protein
MQVKLPVKLKPPLQLPPMTYTEDERLRILVARDGLRDEHSGLSAEEAMVRWREVRDTLLVPERGCRLVTRVVSKDGSLGERLEGVAHAMYQWDGKGQDQWPLHGLLCGRSAVEPSTSFTTALTDWRSREGVTVCGNCLGYLR